MNNDGEVNITDVNVIIDAILSYNSSGSADVNNDGEVNIADVNAVIDKILNPEPILGTEDPGLYMGITGFNQQLYIKDISLLDRDTKDEFTGFVSSLTTKDATVLYYAVDKSLDALDAAPFPKNLSNVALITFTDGLDQGSLMLTDKGYTSDTQYASALSNRIIGMNVHGCPLQAYSIGLKGSDVTNNEMFMSNLRSLASSENNVALINSMDEIKAKFQEIADSLAKTSYSYSHNLTFTIPGVSNGTLIRFTFDNVNSNTVTHSEKYIEGTFNLSDRSLINVTYHGMASTSGTTVMPKEVNGVYVTYTFENLVLNDPSERIDKNNIQEWYWITNYSKWQRNSEFTPNSIDSVDIETSFTSAIVMLVLDCSSSLSNDFEKMQGAAKEFINTLADYDNYNPNIPNISSAYYYVGSSNGWAPCDETYKLDNGGGDVYANPVFTVVVPATGEDNWFKIYSQETMDLSPYGFWNGDFIGYAVNGENEMSGNFVEGPNDQVAFAFKIPASILADKYRLTFDMMNRTFEFEAIKELGTPDLWYLVGSCIGDGSWGNSPAYIGTSLIPMYPNAEDFSVLTYAGYFPAGQGFKLIHSPGSWDEQWGMIGGVLVKNDGGSKDIKMAADGYYLITYDMTTETLTIEPFTGPVGVYSTMGMPGDYQDWNPGGTLMNRMSFVVENHDWVKDLNFEEYTELKFTANGSWAENWGSYSFPVGTGVLSGPNIPVSIGSYKVVFNDLLHKYYFIPK